MTKRVFSTLAALLLALVGAVQAEAQLWELRSCSMSVSETEATSLTTGQWYVMKNRGRSAYAYENSSQGLIANATAPTGGAHAYLAANCGYLVRLVASGTDGQYYLQTGYGHYFGTLTSGGNNGATSAQTQAYTYGKIASTESHFYLQAAGSYILDCNAAGGTIAGYGTSVPTATGGNNDWAFYAVTLTAGVHFTPGAYRLKGNRDTSNAYYMTNESGKLYARTASSDAPYSQIWIIEAGESGYTFRSASTGQFIQKTTDLETVFSTGSTAQEFYIEGKESWSKIAVSHTAGNFSGNNCLHDAGDHRVVVWNDTEDATWWTLEAIPDADAEDNITTAAVKEYLNTTALGVAQTPTAGKYYRLRNVSYGTAMQEVAGANTVNCLAEDETLYTELWQLEAETDGTGFYLKNAVTGNYIKTWSGKVSNPYLTSSNSDDKHVFTLTDANDAWTYQFFIYDTGSIVLHCDAASQVVGWYTNATASRWYLVEVTPDADALKAAQDEYTNYTNLVANQSTYSTTLKTYFADLAATALNSTYAAMDDDALKTQMTTDGLPATLQDIVLKVKNADWDTYTASDGSTAWDHTEQTFRIAGYAPYTDGNTASLNWTNVIGHDYAFGRLTNPTGITVAYGDVLEVFLGNSIDTDGNSTTDDTAALDSVTVMLEIAAVAGSTGSTYTLSPGLNIIKAANAGNCFVNYTVKNILATELADCFTGTPFTPISRYKDVTVHIEGGNVNGYFDLTRGDDNTDYATLISSNNTLMEQYSAFVMKTKKLVFNVHKAELVSALANSGDYANDMVQLLTDWNTLMDWEEELEGITEYDGTGTDTNVYFNCMLTMTSINRAYMYASSYGTYYNANTLSTVLNAYQIHTSGGSLWGPAHENGHVRQGLINSVGQTEVSNNLYSNVAVFKQGYNTCRAADIQTTFTNMASGTFWADRDIWEQTHMYYQLWLYFHVAGVDTDFYPNLFRALRRDRMIKSSNTFVPATSNYLKFYEKACSSSGYDLTEFFQAYGFFILPTQNTYTLNGETQEAYLKDDYGNRYITISQDSIDASIARVKAMKDLKTANPLFIEDRITGVDLDGKQRTAFSNEAINAIGTHGTYGEYTTYYKLYNDETTTPSTSFSYTYDDEGNITITSTDTVGCVGFKIYDSEGNFVYAYNDTRFTIPDALWADLLANGFSIEAAGVSESVKMTGTIERTVNFNVYDPNDLDAGVLYSVSVNYLGGDKITEYPDELVAPDYVSYYDPTTNGAPDYTVQSQSAVQDLTVYYTYSLFSPSHAGDEHYYYVKLADGYVTWYPHTSTGRNNLVTSYPSVMANAQWAFWGDPWNGFALTNRALGTSTYLKPSAASSGSGLATATDKYLWQVSKVSDATFNLKLSEANLYWNRYGGGTAATMGFWSGGSAMSVAGVSEPDDPYDGYYYIQNSYYTAQRLALDVSAATVSASTTVATTSPTTIFRFDPQDDGSYLISSHGDYLKAVSSGSITTTTTASDACYALVVDGGTTGSRALLLSPDNAGGNGYLHYNAGLLLWKADAGASQWTIAPVTEYTVDLHSVTGSGAYATAYLPFAYTLPADFSANALTLPDARHANATELTTVPEATGVLLIGNAGESTVTLNVVAPPDETSATDNVLTGTYTDLAATGDTYTLTDGTTAALFNVADAATGAYTLSGGASGTAPGFYVFNGTSLSAYKAFIPGTDATSNVRAILLDGSVLTAIDRAAAPATPAATYDLQGRRITRDRARHGLYIRDGKKMIVK